MEVIPLRIPFKAPYKIATSDNAERAHFDVVIMTGNHPITSVAAAATAHLCAAWSGPLIEGCFAENMAGEQADEIVCNPPVIEGGDCIVATGPGFGMVLDEAKIKRYRLDAHV